jgi:hypothetical protein
MTRMHLRRWLYLGGLSACAVGAVVASVASGVACGRPYSATTPDAPSDAGSAASDAGSEASAEASGPVDPCAHVRFPSPPVVDDAPGDELPPFYLAVRQITLSNDTKTIKGYDLDGVCTCDTDPATAHLGVSSCASSQPTCDLDGGVDNAVSVLSARLTPFFSLDSVPQRLIDTGRKTLLIEIGKYNGKRNDKEVAFAVALSDGIRTPGCASSVENVGKGIWSPGWCGDDTWSFLPEAVVPATKQPLVQGLGFVADGVLSLRLDGALLLPFDESAVLPVSGALVTGTLTPLGEDLQPRDPNRAPTEREKRLYMLDNALAGGRIKAEQLMGAIGTVDTSPPGSPAAYLCEQASWELARKGICDAVDLASAPSLDFDPARQMRFALGGDRLRRVPGPRGRHPRHECRAESVRGGAGRGARRSRPDAALYLRALRLGPGTALRELGFVDHLAMRKIESCDA